MATAAATTSSTTTMTTQQPQPQLLPPLSVKPSISIQSEDSVFSRLGATPLPDKEINTILNLHENLSLTQVIDHFDTCMDKLTRWLETAQMAIFSLELSLKEDHQPNSSSLLSLEDDQWLELTFGRMEPLMSILVEVGHIVEDKLDMDDNVQSTKKMQTRMSITKIQSEWSGLQHFMSSVLKQLDSMNEKKELTLLMENVLQQIDDLSIMMFQFQEKRHALAIVHTTTTTTTTGTPTGTITNPLLDNSTHDPMSSPISTTSSLFSPSSTTTTTTTTHNTVSTTATSLMNDTTTSLSLSSTTTNNQTKDENILAEIDRKVEPLFNDVQRIYGSMTSNTPPEDPSGMLTRKHHMVQHRWETLRIEIDDLKEELKEDRWLVVFRQVADQVDVMIDGLDKTVIQCYTVIDQVREWYASSSSSSTTTTTSQQQQQGSSSNNAFNRFSKSIMRSFPHRHHQQVSSPSSSSTTTTSQPPPPPPIDREKFRSIEKNFEAKYKYYTPSIGKMLGMLGNGIVSRVARNNGTSKRHSAMMQRWSTLKLSMDTLRNKDLPETERMLTEGMYLSSSTNTTSGWKSIRYKTPEPHHNNNAGGGGETLVRAKSNNALYKSSTTLTTQQRNPYYQQDHHSAIGGGGMRSVTPSGNRSMFGNSNKVTQHPPRAASSMAYARDIRPSASESSSMDYPLNNTRRTMTPMGTSTNNHQNESKSLATRKSRVPNHQSRADNDKDHEVSWMKPTKSTLMRTARKATSVDQGLQQHQQRPKTPTSTVPQRSKTPTPGYTRRKSTTPNIPSRPKSSLGRQQQQQLLVPEYDNNTNNDDHYPNQQRSVSPYRRTMTPSFIPRPKTPNASTLRCESPSLIPRPKSSMASHHYYQAPPVPPLPTSVQQKSSASSLKKKQSMPALMHRTASPFRTTHVPTRAPSPHYRRRQFSEEDDDDDNSHDFSLMSRGSFQQQQGGGRQEMYIPNPKDPLDREVARIVNASPISVKCSKGPLGGGRYFFGNELNPSVGGGRKLYTCKLMTYENNNNSQRRSKPAQNKVLIRIGGGFEDLELFLLRYGTL